jgi:hypothetical protein
MLRVDTKLAKQAIKMIINFIILRTGWGNIVKIDFMADENICMKGGRPCINVEEGRFVSYRNLLVSYLLL